MGTSPLRALSAQARAPEREDRRHTTSDLCSGSVLRDRRVREHSQARGLALIHLRARDKADLWHAAFHRRYNGTACRSVGRDIRGRNPGSSPRLILQYGEQAQLFHHIGTENARSFFASLLDGHGRADEVLRAARFFSMPTVCQSWRNHVQRLASGGRKPPVAAGQQGAYAPRSPKPAGRRSLQRDLRPAVFELLLERLGFFLGDVFLHGLGVRPRRGPWPP